MGNYIGKICNHIYAEGAQEAVKLYKKAFNLEEAEPLLDENGFIIHQNLLQDSELYISVTEKKYLPDDRFVKLFDTSVCPAMLFYIFFSHEDDLRKAYIVLQKDGTLCKDVYVEENDIVCEVIDKFGVFWHLRVPKHLNESGIPEYVGLSI